ncbi:MAG: hypothetical protein IT372_33995 [Polyangiaceae bacterium]|nr:hypothetical protein [Polyangiaceae bacterium]
MSGRAPAAPAACALACALALTACSLGQGEGEVHSDRLIARDCWDRAYDLQPDFFAAVPYRETLQIRVQRGNDLQEVSDGLAILVDDIETIRNEKLGAALQVALPRGVQPPGSPVPEPGPLAGTSLVHMGLYLQQSCHNQNTVLYAVSGEITFSALFSGDPNEKDAAEKYTDASFDVMVGDPRDAAPGAPADAIPEELQSRLTGYFRFYFERGQPGQPFP